MEPKIEYPLTPGMPVSPLPFSPVVRFGDLLFVSGQASVDSAGRLVSDSFEAEFRRALENLRLILEAAGSGLSHVIQTRNYVRDPANLPLFNELYREYFRAPFPARATITSCLPDSMHYEVEVVAAPRL